MKVKLYKRSPVILNTIFFVVLSSFFLHIMNSLNVGQSAFSLNSYNEFLVEKAWLFTIGTLAIINIYFANRWAKPFYVTYFVLSFFYSFMMFFESFDKALLLLSVVYLLIGFYFYIVLKLEFEEASYHPGYHYQKMGEKSEYHLEVNVKSIKTGRSISGCLTNWDKNSLFLSSKDLRGLKGPVYLELSLDGKSFHCNGDIVSRYPYGCGVRLSHKQKPKRNGEDFSRTLNWQHYYDIIDSRGYKPSL